MAWEHKSKKSEAEEVVCLVCGAMMPVVMENRREEDSR